MQFKKMKQKIQPQTNEEHMHLKRNEAHYAIGNKWSTLCNCKQMKPTMQLQTNAANNATGNK
jgi:hypothetical protein